MGVAGFVRKQAEGGYLLVLRRVMVKKPKTKPLVGLPLDPDELLLDTDFDDSDEIVHRHPTLFASCHPHGTKVRDFEEDPE